MSTLEQYKIFIQRLFNEKFNSQLQMPWRAGFIFACELGMRDLVDFLLTANKKLNLNDGLWGACCGGHREIVDLIIERGANNFIFGFQGACEGGHLDLAKLMVEFITNGGHVFIPETSTLESACKNGHYNIVKFLTKLESSFSCNAFKLAIRYRHFNVARLLMRFYARGKRQKESLNFSKFVVNKFIRKVCDYGGDVAFTCNSWRIKNTQRTHRRINTKQCFNIVCQFTTETLLSRFVCCFNGYYHLYIL